MLKKGSTIQLDCIRQSAPSSELAISKVEIAGISEWAPEPENQPDPLGRIKSGVLFSSLGGPR